MTLPNFFIVGAPKCGTTSMYYWLSEHPQVFMSNPKEPHYWNEDMDNNIVSSFEEYSSLFSNVLNQEIIGEASTWYLFSSNAIKNIEKTISPKPKYLVMIRNPLEMVKSLYKHNYRRYNDNVISFEKAWKLQEKRKRNNYIPKNCDDKNYLLYGKACSLGSQLERMLDIVPRKRVKIIVLEDIKKNTIKEYKSLLSFLNLDYKGKENFSVKNKGQKVKFRKLQKSLYYAKKIKKILGINYNMGLLSSILSLNKKEEKNKIEISDDLKKEMNDFFEGEINILSELLERNFSYWFY